MLLLLLLRRLTRRPALPPPTARSPWLWQRSQAGPSPLARCSSTGSSRDGAGAGDGERLDAARAWLAALHAQTIPWSTIGELTFSTSSGAGGQNVNR